MRPTITLPLLSILACLTLPRPARAAPEPADATTDAPPPPRLALFHDLDDGVLAPRTGAGSLAFSVAGTLHSSDAGRDAGVMLYLTVPLERIGRGGGHAPIAQESGPRGGSEGGKGAGSAEEKRRSTRTEPTDEPAERTEESAPAASGPATEEAPVIPVRITPAIARAAVHAALARAHLVAPDERLDALASRARTSALLPELRLRVTRLVDEAQNLSPTEYDPSRTTASGGASLWLEARATWRLDRLAFADEEIAIERLRADRTEAQEKLAFRVLDLLFAWQRGLTRQADPGLDPEQRLAATLKVIEAEASLDVVTDGWFTRWRGESPMPRR